MECHDMIRENLCQAGFDSVMLEETKNWKPANGRNFNLKKDQAVFIPESL